MNKKSKSTQITALDVDGKQVCDNKAIAESMNDFFCNIGKNLSDKLPQTENALLESRFSVNEHNLRFEFQAVNIAQVEKVFCNIFNLSIATGVFPDCWEIARVAPIFESGQSDDRSNYRLILVLPFLSRVFEKLVFNQLYEYLDKNKLIHNKQSGFTSYHSAFTCLLESKMIGMLIWTKVDSLLQYLLS